MQVDGSTSVPRTDIMFELADQNGAMMTTWTSTRMPTDYGTVSGNSY